MSNISINRAERRRMMRAEGRTGKWEERLSPKAIGQGSGWFGEMDRVWVNDKYCVMARDIDTAWGKVTHACIRNTSSTDIPWAEKQKIKNELFGEHVTAVEVFPDVDELVDEAYMYHLWILSQMEIPFTIADRAQNKDIWKRFITGKMHTEGGESFVKLLGFKTLEPHPVNLEDGEVLAVIDRTGYVNYIDERAKTDKRARRRIELILHQLKKEL